MNYKETLDFMYSQLPMFHRVGKEAYKDNLDNALALDSLCGHPHHFYPTIHVGGTNGKGSVSHMLASVLQTAGYKTGLFTSPHLKDFRERIRVNGEMIPEDAVSAFITSYESEFLELKPSFFEMTSALALDFFRKEKVDIAVIEVGMGGRLDSTNIITPVLSVITNISFDHTLILGDTYPKIAFEKAGIIKNRIPVIVGETHPETQSVFEKAAFEKKSDITFADKKYKAASVRNDNTGIQTIEVISAKHQSASLYDLDLLGMYQQKNICTVLASIDVLNKSGFTIAPASVASGLRNASGITGLNGRWQILGHDPLTICDTGHNQDGIAFVVQQILQLSYGKLHFVFGMVNDKDITHIIELLPKEGVYYFTKANIPRALNEEMLKEQCSKIGLYGNSYPTVKIAVENAKKNASSNDLIFIGGSTFIVAEALLLQWKN